MPPALSMRATSSAWKHSGEVDTSATLDVSTQSETAVRETSASGRRLSGARRSRWERLGLSEEEALAVLDADRDELVDCLFSLDPFGDDELIHLQWRTK